MDQLMCESLNVTECGKPALHAFIVSTILVPIALIKRLRFMAIVNGVIMVLTLISMASVLYYSIKIYGQTAAENKLQFGLTIPDGKDYKLWDWGALAVFMCGFQNIYEGNTLILNLYSEL